MKSKVLVCGALAAALTMSVALSSGCGNATRNEADMNQVIATVDITKNTQEITNAGLGDYASAIDSEKQIIKRDLIAAFYNVGSSLLSDGSASNYGDAFKTLVTALTNTAVVTQYATLMLISERDGDANDTFDFDEFMNKTTAVEKYEYLLEGQTSENEGKESDRILLAKYALYSSINSSIDSIEQTIIDEESESTSSDETRAVPGGAGSERTDFLPLNDDGTLNYNIYTGYKGYEKDDSGAYKDDALEGSTKHTRRTAYAYFVTNLRDNFLITEDDDVRDILSVSYIEEEYLSQLQQQVINEYYERYETAQEELIDAVEGGQYTFLKDRYESMLEDQEISNAKFSTFETSMGSLSDTSFILYAPATDETEGGTYGYVYNILLPFSATQNINIDSSDTSAEYYYERMSLMDEIVATDQRSAWFNGSVDYSFDASKANFDYYMKGEGRDYLFFEDNLVNSARYEDLQNYAGLYPYNGTVSKNADGSYSLTPNKLTVDDVMDEFVDYVNYVMGGEYASWTKNTDKYYVSSPEDYYEVNEDGTVNEDAIDYSRFVYATGSVDVGIDETGLSSYLTNLFVKDSAAYKALSAVNELQYAYTTDTGVLSNYIGYTVSAFDTSYIPEFEYAAQEAVKQGPGTIYVCAGDYGWHIVYVTATFDVAGGAVYGENVDWSEEAVTTQGTFQNMFYNWVKDSVLTNVTDTRRTVIIKDFGGDTTISLFEDRYSDLLELTTTLS